MTLHTLANAPGDKKGLITTAESYSCGAPGDEEGTRRHRLCSNLLGPEAKQMGRSWKQSAMPE